MSAVIDDYQQFTITNNEIDSVGPRMQAKLKAIPLPDVAGKDVLDVGCDMGFWSFLCASRDARVVGLDRGRPVKGVHTDLVAQNAAMAKKHFLPCMFHDINVGEQWRTYGRFDLVMLFSLYHHIFAQVEEHEPIWLWLWLQTRGELLWENPVSTQDGVVQMNVPVHLHALYTEEAILAAASKYFEVDEIGPALHEPHRKVFRFLPKGLEKEAFASHRRGGAGGASKAWAYDDHARTKEFEHIMGHKVIEGSINLLLSKSFHWDRGYFRAKMRDVVDRGNGLDGAWAPRWVRIYPVFANYMLAYVFRFEGEKYPENFAELVSPHQIDGTIILESYAS